MTATTQRRSLSPGNPSLFQLIAQNGQAQTQPFPRDRQLVAIETLAHLVPRSCLWHQIGTSLRVCDARITTYQFGETAHAAKRFSRVLRESCCALISRGTVCSVD